MGWARDPGEPSVAHRPTARSDDGAKGRSVPGLDESRLETLLKLNQMTGASMHQVTEFALEEAVRLTKSKVGYLAFVNDDESVLTMHAWSKVAMDECQIDRKPRVYPVETTGLWGEPVRQRRPVILNDYEELNPLKRGYPAGHIPINRHMGIPVFDGDRIVAVAGVGNKEEEYSNSDVRQLTLLMEGMWLLLQRQRSEEKIRKSLDEKEVLLKEIHHRVKNNLQIISSLLSLQTGQVKDQQLVETLRESQNRIRSMALIHERLYRSNDLAHVDFGEYVQNLATSLCRSYNSIMPQVECEVDAAAVPLQIDVGAQPVKSFTVMISSPGGGGTLGARTTAEVRERPIEEALALIEAVLLPDSLPYRTLADSTGWFRMTQMPAGTYLVYGILDTNGDRRRGAREAGGNRHLAGNFFFVVIGSRGAVVDAAQTLRGARGVKRGGDQ